MSAVVELSQVQIDNLRKWTVALRSGEYIQGENFLYTIDDATNEHSYCCLGVACEINGLDAEMNKCKVDGLTVYEYDFRDSYPNFIGEYVKLATVPDVFAVKMYGIDEDGVHMLMKMNDTGKSFSEIADYIEELIHTRYGVTL